MRPVSHHSSLQVDPAVLDYDGLPADHEYEVDLSDQEREGGGTEGGQQELSNIAR